MNGKVVEALPKEAFVRGIGAWKRPLPLVGETILGFDTEWDTRDGRIVSYQLSDGDRSVLLEAEEDLDFAGLDAWARETAASWSHDPESRLVLASYFSTAELSHIRDFWKDAKVRRVSPQQVFNASYKGKDGRTDVFDLYHFFNASLEKVAPVWGEKKLDFDASTVTRDSLRDPFFREYAVNDAVLCARILGKFRARVRADWGIDVLQAATPASLAMGVYRRHFLPKGSFPPPTEVRRFAWKSLWGGRVEAYARGDFSGDWVLLDVSSLYPASACLFGPLPEAGDWRRTRSPRSARGLARVRFRFPEGSTHLCIPVKLPEGSLVYPLEGAAYCTLAEVALARELGAVVEVCSAWEAVRGTDALARFMSRFRKLKDRAEAEGDEPGRALSKLLMNSLIGKFSQNRGDLGVEDAKTIAKTYGVPLETVLDPKFRVPEKELRRFRIGQHVMPEWSALVLGLARALMGRLVVGTKSLILSTDSLLVPANDEARLVAKAASLGLELKVKARVPRVKVVRSRVYASPTVKDDRGREKVVVGSGHAIHLRPVEQVRVILEGSDRYRTVRRVGLKSAVRHGLRFFAETDVEMKFDLAWDGKRELLADGSTRPWRFARDSLLPIGVENRKP